MAAKMMEEKSESGPKARFITTSQEIAAKLVEEGCEAMRDAMMGGVTSGFEWLTYIFLG